MTKTQVFSYAYTFIFFIVYIQSILPLFVMTHVGNKEIYLLVAVTPVVIVQYQVDRSLFQLSASENLHIKFAFGSR